MATSRKQAPGFEANLAELEAIVSAMESGKLPLEDALANYQRGVALLRDCNATLRSAEQKVAILDADGLRSIAGEGFPGQAAVGESQ